MKSNSPVMYSRDWRSALRTPPTYRIGNRTVRFNFHFALFLTCTCALFFLFFYTSTGSTSSSDTAWLKRYASSSSVLRSSTYEYGRSMGIDATKYNATYPLTKPIVGRGGIITYRIGMIADMDTNSKVTKNDGSTVWRSYFKKGYLIYAGSKGEIKIKWDDGAPVELESAFALKGRGMELSELVTYNGKLLTFDDRTGLVYEIENDKTIPFVILLDGNGHSMKGFKSEWATVKNQMLYVGSMGKEWTSSTGAFENDDPMFVKMINTKGEVRSLDWSFSYKNLRLETLNIKYPGYMIHESGVWSEDRQKWYFLPRRCSTEKYNETRDEHMGCNVLLSADDHFAKFEIIHLDNSNTMQTRGFSSFKFVPGTDDRIILAIKSEEVNGRTTTYITVIDINGKTLMSETQIDTDVKYEGIEFI